MSDRTHGFTRLMFWLALVLGTFWLWIPVLVPEYGWRATLAMFQHAFLKIIHEEKLA